jgi:Fe-S oxidoreductase
MGGEQGRAYSAAAMSPFGMSVLMLLAFAGFAALAWRKLQVVLALQPEVRWDQPWQRARSVLVNGLLQQRMLQREWRPGLMHAVIFLGFMSLLLRKLQLIVIGYDEHFVFPAAFGGPFAAFKDVIELAVTLAVLYAFWRRFVLRPARLEPNREALLVLSLILAIMLTDFAFDGFRFALLADKVPGIAHERDFAFLGSVVGDAFAGLSPVLLSAGYTLSYWTQMVVVFCFLVLLPAGEHFHIVTALPALFFRRGRPGNRVSGVDIDKLMEATDEADMKAGVRTVLDLNWKEGLDAFTCTECGRCKVACPTHLTGKPLSLKAVNDSLKHHLMEQRQTLVAGDPKNQLPALVGPVISEDTLWACTSCGFCEAACPIELEHLDKFFRMRQHQVMIAGEFPHELKKVFEAYESQGNPWGLQSGQRGDWAQGLEVPVIANAADMAGLDYLFYVGSAMSFDPRGQKIARAFVVILKQAGVRFGILGAREGSTGECVRRVGNEMLFQQLATALVGTLGELGVTRIVTCDPHALNSLRHEYPEFGGHYQLVHHTQLIQELLAQGRIRVTASLQRVVFHDPCYLGRHNGEFDAPRDVLQRLRSDAVLEMPLSREKAMCCGAGGGRMWMEETIGKRINITRVEQALELQPKLIATACPYCAVMVADGLGAAQPGGATASKDIAELVAEALVREPA